LNSGWLVSKSKHLRVRLQLVERRGDGLVRNALADRVGLQRGDAGSEVGAGGGATASVAASDAMTRKVSWRDHRDSRVGVERRDRRARRPAPLWRSVARRPARVEIAEK